MLAAISVTQAKDSKASNSSSGIVKNEESISKCKPSDLPLYTPLSASIRKEIHHTQEKSQQSFIQENIESAIRSLRSEVQAGWHFITQRTDYISDQYQNAKSRVLWTIDYLNEPQNLLPRTGAISAGGLAGFICAARGGLIKKFLFTTIGAGAMASMCYPHQAEQLSEDLLQQARRGYNISYNFVKGVKPGEEVNAETISKFPRSLEDIKFLVYDLYDEAKEAIFPPK